MQVLQREKNQAKNCVKLTKNHGWFLHLQGVHIFAIKAKRVNHSYNLLIKNQYFEGIWMQNTAFFVKKVNNSYAIGNQIVSVIFRICQKWQKMKIKA